MSAASKLLSDKFLKVSEKTTANGSKSHNKMRKISLITNGIMSNYIQYLVCTPLKYHFVTTNKNDSKSYFIVMFFIFVILLQC